MTGRRHASVIRLIPEREEEYRRLHAEVWPTVRDRLKQSNISNYSICLRDGYLRLFRVQRHGLCSRHGRDG